MSNIQTQIIEASNAIIENIINDKWYISDVKIEDRESAHLSVAIVANVPESKYSHTEFLFVEGAERERFFFESLKESMYIYGEPQPIVKTVLIHAPISREAFMKLHSKYDEWLANRSERESERILKVLEPFTKR